MPTPTKSKSPSVASKNKKAQPAKTAKELRKAVDKAAAAKDAPAELKKIPKPEDVGYMGPSSSKSLAICASWYGEPREDQDTGAADEGTLMHASSDTGDLSPLVTDEQRRLVQTCLDYRAHFQKPGDAIFTELKLPVRYNSTVKRNGIIDLILIHGGKNGDSADVMDWKFGKIGVDDAEQNWQGWHYVVAAFDNWEKLKRVTVHFIQPRRDEVSSHTFTRKQVETLRDAIREVYESTQIDPKKRKYVFNDSNCTYCGRRAVCPALAAAAKKIAAVYDPESLPSFDTRPSETTDPNQFAMMIPVAKVMEKWAGSVKEHAKQFMLAGHEIPGFKLQEKSGGAYIDGAMVPLVYAKLTRPPMKPGKKKGVYIITGPAMMEEEEVLSACTMNYHKILEAYAMKFPEAGTKAKVSLSNVLAELGAVAYGASSFYPTKD